MSTLMILVLIGCVSMSLGTEKPRWGHLKIRNRRTKTTFACVAFQKESNAQSFTVADAKAHCKSLNRYGCTDMEMLDDLHKAKIFANMFLRASKKYKVLRYTGIFLTSATGTNPHCTNCMLKKMMSTFFTKTPGKIVNGNVGIMCAKKK